MIGQDRPSGRFRPVAERFPNGGVDLGERQAPATERSTVGSVIKKRRKRMAKKKHRKLLKKTRIQRRRAGR
jgi:hypothetical protein